MVSKIWFGALVLSVGCRLGTPRPDGAEGPPSSTAVSPSAAPLPARPGTAGQPAAATPPAILTLPQDLETSSAAASSVGLPAAKPPASLPSAPIASAAPNPARPSGARRRRIAVLGDSLSDPRVGGGGYVARVGEACPSAVIENFAKGGFMVNQMRRRFEAQVLSRLPADFDELIVFGGVNDLYSDETAGRTVEKISADLAAIYRAAKERGTRVVALTVTPWAGFSRYYNPRRAAATLRLNAWILAQAETGLVDVVLDAYPLLACGERLCPEYEAPFHDGLHFGKLGQRRLGDELVRLAYGDCKAPANAP